MYVNVLTFLFLLSSGFCALIIPDELPSLLSVLYANIPPIKKGTDSRIGFGYSFGPHADFQVMLELGPQTNTNKVGQPFTSNAKRQAPPIDDKQNKNRDKFYESDAGKFLQNWAENMKKPKKPQKAVTHRATTHRPGDVPNLLDSLVEVVKNDKGEYELHQPKPEHMAQDVLDNLKTLYGEKKEVKGDRKRSEEEVKKITEDLSNVDMDDK